MGAKTKILGSNREADTQASPPFAPSYTVPDLSGVVCEGNAEEPAQIRKKKRWLEGNTRRRGDEWQNGRERARRRETRKTEGGVPRPACDGFGLSYSNHAPTPGGMQSDGLAKHGPVHSLLSYHLIHLSPFPLSLITAPHYCFTRLRHSRLDFSSFCCVPTAIS